MKFFDRINLIPRNNWDYGINSLFLALSSVNKETEQLINFQKVFHQNPIWTNSGRTSLYAILKSLGLPPGAKVGVPLFCCSVVFNAIQQAGFSPCFIDSNTNDFNVSIEDLIKKHKDLAAVVVVHMFGNPCDMDEINSIVGTVPVIEDCAQSVFSTYKEEKTGLLSTASFFSFRCGKYISAGEGSAIICKDVDLQKRIERVVNSFESWSPPKMFINSIMTFIKATLYNRPWYGLVGYPIGMRLDKKMNLTAKDGFEAGKIAPSHLALIDERITHFQERITVQRTHAQMLLKGVVPEKFSLPAVTNGCTSNWYQFAIKFQNSHQRDAMAEFLLNHGVDTSKYLDNIADEAQSNYGYTGDCPNAENLSKTILLVPIHYNLQASDIDHIICFINEGSKLL
jgi:dTDP-4-amino-4,6-dideoxygalactose transaminase